MKKYRVWTCKLVIEHDGQPFPLAGSDGPPRKAAIAAVEAQGVPVVAMFSGWGGELSDVEREIVDERGPGTDGAYIAGFGPWGRA